MAIVKPPRGINMDSTSCQAKRPVAINENPERSKIIGNRFLCFEYDSPIDHVPIRAEKKIMVISTQVFAKNSRPIKGNDVTTIGKTAQ